MKPIKNIEKYSRARAIFSIIFCSLTAVFFLIGISIKLLTPEGINIALAGGKSYRAFTVDSNVIVAICALLCIPYEIDGLRNLNYHMPRWLIGALYVGTTTVTLTFLIAVAVLSPVAGFHFIMIENSNLYFHTICPILSMILFILIANDHNIKRWTIGIAMAPVIIYAFIYIFMCFILGEENGGWADHYRLNTYVPWPVAGILLLAVAFLVTMGLRLAHNKIHAIQKARYREYYLNLEYSTIEEAIIAMAQKAKANDPGNNDVVIPRRVFQIMNKRYQSELSMTAMCELYIKNILND